MRVALFGGSFDPPHEGHVAIARAAADAFALDRVLFAPAGRQPLKMNAHPSPFPDRLAMVELVCAADARFQATDLDGPRPDGEPNYTVDTLEALRAAEPDAEIFAIIGADAYLDMRRWRKPDRLLQLAQWIVVTRPGFSLHLTQEAEREGRIHLLDRVQVDISATETRERLQHGLDCTGLISPLVLRYIEAHHLYQ